MTPYKPQETFGKNLRHGLVESEALIASLERVRRAHAGVKKNVVPSITTFYSHEDSPIRSTALLFTAALLAERGQRVLLVDWNLESPGIARDAQGAASTPGLVELLRSFTEPQKLSWRDCVFPVRSFLGSTELHVLSAGRDDVDYEARFRGLNVAQLVERHDLGRRLEAIRAEWLGAYDAILIDSPPGTGLLSGLCVIHLADRVVLLLAPDKKSISVAKSILRRATAQQMRLPLDRKRLIAIPVLAVETATALDASWRELAAQELGEFLADWLPRSARPVDAIPSLAVGANPSSSDFLSDYNRLARLLDGDMTELAQTNPGGVRPFPLQRSSRYRPLKWIKDGAMGSVWRAYNCNLGIEVALKFVRGGDYERTKAILAEGRNMARVDHDRVVKVLEVGEAEGQAFIAMQYVDGETLGQKAPHLTIEQKVLLLRDVAFGVQAVHEAGLIHRDIKPSSILVKDSSEGLKPYLMGFGVARKEKVAANETRELIGTPEYMSPEQVRGYVASLDRRADVYGLGATLYALLVGRPPFQDEDELRLLHRVLREKPVSPRERVPDVSEDLAAISLRCLEKDRSARYASARELADDLNRYLRGDPVRARQGTGYRLRRQLRKHRRLVALGASAALALGLIVVPHQAFSVRERLTNRFTERVERIESQALNSGLAPVHDLQKDREALRARMFELDAEIRKGGARAVGPGQYALGRGYLALGDHVKAREALETAWAEGFREPRVAYAMVLALGREYQERLSEAQRIQEEKKRRAKVAQVRDRYTGQVLTYLALSKGVEAPSQEYLAALLAFYEQRYDDALSQLAAIQGTPTWVHEIAELRGEIFQARAFERWEAGDQPGWRADIKAAEDAYEEAAEIARSVPSIHMARARLELFALIVELFGRGDVQSHYDRGLAALEPISILTPDDAEAWALQAQFHRRLADFRLKNGGDVEEPLAKALRAANEAMKTGPTSAEVKVQLAQVYWQRGYYLYGHAKDPREDIRRAVELLEGVADEERDLDYYLGLGAAFGTWADAEDMRGEDSVAHRSQAIEAFLAATRLDERSPRAWTNLGMAYFQRASAPREMDPEGDLRQAQEVLAKAQARYPTFTNAFYYGGQVSLLRASRAQIRSGNPRPLFSEALEQYRRCLALNPKLLACFNGMGKVHFALAQEDWDQGKDPSPLLDLAREDFEKMLAIDPTQPQAHVNLAETLARQALYRAASGGDPTELTRKALRQFHQAERHYPDSPLPWSNQGLALIVQAKYDLEHGLDPSADLATANAKARKAQARARDDEASWRVLGGTSWLDVRRKARGPDAYEAVAGTYEQGLKAVTEPWDLRRDYLQVCLDWAESFSQSRRDPGVALARARLVADQIVNVRSKWAEGRALHAWVQALEAERAPPEERPALRQKAKDELDAALAANSNLVPAWRERQGALARRLASQQH